MSGWYALRAEMRRERLAVEAVKALGFQVHAPVERVARRWRGILRKVEVRPFGRYFFVRFDVNRDHWFALRRTEGVDDLICAKLQVGTKGDFVKMPIRIPDPQMARIFDWKEYPDLIEAARVGDIVRIISGPFAGHSGRVCELYGEKYQAKVEVVLFDRPTPARFELDQLEKV